MRTMLLAAAAALTLSAGAALADNGEDLGWAFSPNVPARTAWDAQPARTAQPQVVSPDSAPAVVVGHAVSDTQDSRTDTNYPISWGSG